VRVFKSLCIFWETLDWILKKDERIVNFLVRTVKLSLCGRILSVNAAVDVLDFLTYFNSKNVQFYSVIKNESVCFRWRDLYFFPAYLT